MTQNNPSSAEIPLKTWSVMASEKVVESPQTFNVTPAVAEEFVTRTRDYVAVLDRALDPVTRTAITVAEKNAVKADFLKYCRKLARTISNDMAVSDSARRELQLHVRREPVRQHPPADTPDVDVLDTGATWLRIRMHSGGRNERRALPADVMGAEVYAFVGAVAPPEIDGWKFWGNTTNPRVTVDLGSAVTPGARVWVRVRWFNRRGTGPLSWPTEVRLAGTGMAAVAMRDGLEKGEVVLKAA